MRMPGISLTFGGVFGIFAVIALAALGIYLYSKRGLVVQAAESVNPLNNDNVFATAANTAASAATGEQTTFGGWLYDITHPSVERAISGNPPTS